MNKQEILAIFGKIEKVKELHEKEDKLYYNLEAMRRDIMNVYGFINKLAKSRWIGEKLHIPNWNQIPNLINKETNLANLAKTYSNLVEITNDFKKQVEKMRF